MSAVYTANWTGHIFLVSLPRCTRGLEGVGCWCWGVVGEARGVGGRREALRRATGELAKRQNRKGKSQ